MPNLKNKNKIYSQFGSIIFKILKLKLTIKAHLLGFKNLKPNFKKIFYNISKSGRIIRFARFYAHPYSNAYLKNTSNVSLKFQK